MRKTRLLSLGTAFANEKVNFAADWLLARLELDFQIMKKGTRRLLGGMALAAGALGAVGAVIAAGRGKRGARGKPSQWARPGMSVVFRAELMPGRDGSERTFRIKELLPSGRVVLEDFSGEHAEKEFERIR
jgi:hypothetical protein